MPRIRIGVRAYANPQEIQKAPPCRCDGSGVFTRAFNSTPLLQIFFADNFFLSRAIAPTRVRWFLPPGGLGTIGRARARNVRLARRFSLSLVRNDLPVPRGPMSRMLFLFVCHSAGDLLLEILTLKIITLTGLEVMGLTCGKLVAACWLRSIQFPT